MMKTHSPSYLYSHPLSLKACSVSLKLRGQWSDLRACFDGSCSWRLKLFPRVMGSAGLTLYCASSQPLSCLMPVVLAAPETRLLASYDDFQCPMNPWSS